MDLAKLAALAKQAPVIGNATVDEQRELHVDGDYAAYYYSGTDSTSPWEARRAMIDAITAILGKTGCARVVVHMTAGGSHKGHRYKIATVKPYQGQRDNGRKPKNWHVMRSWLEGGATGLAHCEVVTWEDREADDGCAWCCADAWANGKIPFVLSRDKDFRMFAAHHVVWTTHEIVVVPPGTWAITHNGDLYGHKWFWSQMLQGDTADNIPGLERYIDSKGKAKLCGPATADKLLVHCHDNLTAADAVFMYYLDYYQDDAPDRLVEQAALLWMRTDPAAHVLDFLSVLAPQASDLADAVEEASNALITRIEE